MLIILILSSSLFVLILSFEGILISQSRDRYAKKGYIYIGKDTSFNGIVNEAYFDKGFHVIDMKENSTPIFLTGGVDMEAKEKMPDNFNRYFLAEFIREGDSIYKYSDVDTVYILRKGRIYSFFIDYYYNPYEEE